MNLGLDATLDDKWVLPRDDEFYGKLSFFDHYALHWDSEKDLTYIIGNSTDSGLHITTPWLRSVAPSL